MKKIYSNIIEYRGTHYDFGFLQGELLRDSLLVKNREKQWKVRNPRFTVPERKLNEPLQVWHRKFGKKLSVYRMRLDGRWNESYGSLADIGWNM